MARMRANVETIIPAIASGWLRCSRMTTTYVALNPSTRVSAATTIAAEGDGISKGRKETPNAHVLRGFHAGLAGSGSRLAEGGTGRRSAEAAVPAGTTPVFSAWRIVVKMSSPKASASCSGDGVRPTGSDTGLSTSSEGMDPVTLGVTIHPSIPSIARSRLSDPLGLLISVARTAATSSPCSPTTVRTRIHGKRAATLAATY